MGKRNMINSFKLIALICIFYSSPLPAMSTLLKFLSFIKTVHASQTKQESQIKTLDDSEKHLSPIDTCMINVGNIAIQKSRNAERSNDGLIIEAEWTLPFHSNYTNYSYCQQETKLLHHAGHKRSWNIAETPTIDIWFTGPLESAPEEIAQPAQQALKATPLTTHNSVHFPTGGMTKCHVQKEFLLFITENRIKPEFSCELSMNKKLFHEITHSLEK